MQSASGIEYLIELCYAIDMYAAGNKGANSRELVADMAGKRIRTTWSAQRCCGSWGVVHEVISTAGVVGTK